MLTATTPSASQNFEVDSPGPFILIVNATWDQTLIWITSPSGQVITPENAVVFGGFCYVEHISYPTELLYLPMSGNGSKWMFKLPDLGTGTFTISATLPQSLPIPPSHNGVVAFTGSSIHESPVGSTFICSPPDSHVDQPIAMSMGVFNGMTPVLGATVTAKIKRQDDLSPLTAVTMLDDGIEADAVAGDGLYSYLFIPEQPDNVPNPAHI